jgi:hypothetical protein
MHLQNELVEKEVFVCSCVKWWWWGVCGGGGGLPTFCCMLYPWMGTGEEPTVSMTFKVRGGWVGRGGCLCHPLFVLSLHCVSAPECACEQEAQYREALNRWGWWQIMWTLQWRSSASRGTESISSLPRFIPILHPLFLRNCFQNARTPKTSTWLLGVCVCR